MSKRLSTLIETWRDAAVELPDDDLIVLVHTPHLLTTTASAAGSTRTG